MTRLLFVLLLLCGTIAPSFAERQDERQDADSPVPPPTPGYAAQQALFDAQTRYDKGDKQQAEALLRDFIKKNPQSEHYLLRFMLGNILAEKGDGQGAIVQYKHTISLYPSYAAGWLNLGKLYYEGGQYGRAADSLLTGYKLSGEGNRTIQYHGAVCRLLNREYQAAITLLEELSAQPEPQQAWVETLVTAYLENQMAPKALASVNGLLAQGDAKPYLWKLRGRIMLEFKDYEGALQSLLIYSHGDELSVEESMLVGNLFSVLKSPSAAAQYYLAAIRKSKERLNVDQAERLAVTYLAAHEPAKAQAFLGDAVRRDPSARLYLLLGKILYDQGIYYDAAEAFSKSAELDPLDGQTHLLRAYCLIKLEDRAASLAALKQAMKFADSKEAAERLLESMEMDRGFGER